MCPKGDDPLTAYSDFRTIILSVSSSGGSLAGNMIFKFNGITFQFPANGNYWPSSECKASLEGHPAIDVVTCFQSDLDSRGNSKYIIELKKFSSTPYENNIFFFDGNPTASKFDCDESMAFGGSNIACSISDLTVGTVPGIPFDKKSFTN